jgi:hypothetical protein
MSAPLTTATKRLVLILAAEGNILSHFETDRQSFPEVATVERDRICRLIYVGGLSEVTAGFAESPSSDIRGAVYQVSECWRIGTKTLDEPRPSRRKRKGATILPFIRAAEGDTA